MSLRAEIAARLEAVTSPFRTAERFSVEEIDPAIRVRFSATGPSARTSWCNTSARGPLRPAGSGRERW